MEEKLEENGVIGSERGRCSRRREWYIPPNSVRRSRDRRTEREIYPLNLTTGKPVTMGASHRGPQMDSRLAQAHFSDPVKDVVKLPTIIKNLEAHLYKNIKGYPMYNLK